MDADSSIDAISNVAKGILCDVKSYDEYECVCIPFYRSLLLDCHPAFFVVYRCPVFSVHASFAILIDNFIICELSCFAVMRDYNKCSIFVLYIFIVRNFAARIAVGATGNENSPEEPLLLPQTEKSRVIRGRASLFCARLSL